MFYNLSIHGLLFGLVGALILYLVIVGIAYGKKLFNWGRLIGQPMVQAASSPPSAGAKPRSDHFPPLIDKPADHPAEQALYQEAESTDSFFEITEDEGATTLLKEAEHVVEEIQYAVNNIASYPANPDEVCSKIRAIVSRYRIFMETDYYDAINNFIVVTVERDCDLTLTEDDLLSLWHAGAQAA